MEWEPSWIVEDFVKLLKPLLVEEYEKQEKPKVESFFLIIIASIKNGIEFDKWKYSKWFK